MYSLIYFFNTFFIIDKKIIENHTILLVLLLMLLLICLWYIYHSRCCLSWNDRWVFFFCVCVCMFCYTDLALIIMHKYPKLFNTHNKEGFSPLKILASRPSAFKSGINLKWWEALLYHCKSTKFLHYTFFIYWGNTIGYLWLNCEGTI